LTNPPGHLWRDKWTTLSLRARAHFTVVFVNAFPLRVDSLIPASTYRGTSLIKNSHPLGPYSRPMPRALWWSQGGMRFVVSEVPL